MSEICFKTHYNYKIVKPVKMSDLLITEQTGYRTTKEIVEGMTLAGQRLNDYRHGMLDNYDEEYDESQEAETPYEVDPVVLGEKVLRRMRYKNENKRREEVSKLDKEASNNNEQEVHV